MRRVYVSTVPRGVKQGRLFVVDWDTKKILLDYQKDIEAIRGMAFHNGQLFMVDNKKSLFRMDRDTFKINKVKEYNCVKHAHMLYSHNDSLWICSTGNDSFVRIDDEGAGDNFEQFFITKDGRRGKDTKHFNSMAWRNSKQYHVYNQVEHVVNYTDKDVVISNLHGAHDIAFIDDDRFIVNSSEENCSYVCSLSKKDKVEILNSGAKVKYEYAQLGFMRGLEINNSNNTVFIGSAPADIHVLALDDFKKIDFMKICDELCVAVYDICLDVFDWQLYS